VTCIAGMITFQAFVAGFLAQRSTKTIARDAGALDGFYQPERAPAVAVAVEALKDKAKAPTPSHRGQLQPNRLEYCETD